MKTPETPRWMRGLVFRTVNGSVNEKVEGVNDYVIDVDFGRGVMPGIPSHFRMSLI